MKHFFSLLILALTIVGPSRAAEYVSPYYISSRSIDSTLDAGNGMFAVKFYSPLNSPVQAMINITVDHCSISQAADANGFVHFGTSSGKHVIYFSTYNYEEVRTDTIVVADREKIEITVNFSLDNESRPMKKPVIYVYAQENIQMNISMDLHGFPLLFSYPEHNSGWEFTAKPGGEIAMKGKSYKYLFWEGGNANAAFTAGNAKQGYCVERSNLLEFLEKNLDKMGFNSREKQDFITFWYPQMQQNNMNYIRFIFNDDCNIFANLNCNPQPQNIYRMSMLWTSVSNEIAGLQEQDFPVIDRTGLTVVEWGGGNIKEEMVINTGKK
jgi:hypothetical protein